MRKTNLQRIIDDMIIKAVRAVSPLVNAIPEQCKYGIELAFGAETKHIQAKGLTGSKNIIERFHGTLKARTKVMRGLKKRETAKLITDGWLVHYNFFRPHSGIGDFTPAQKAGIRFPYRDWLDVVKGGGR